MTNNSTIINNFESFPKNISTIMAYTYTFIVRSGRDNIDINDLKIGPNFFNNCDYKIIQTDQISYCLSILPNKEISDYDFDKCRIITISTDIEKRIFVWRWKNTNLIISVNIQRITKFTNDQKTEIQNQALDIRTKRHVYSRQVTDFIKKYKINPDYQFMTGAQFNEVFPDPKMRLFNEKLVHNDFAWQEGLNTCPDWKPEVTCNNGLYFISPCDRENWLEYNGNIMVYQAMVTIPDDAAVSVELYNDYSLKFKANMIIIHDISVITHKNNPIYNKSGQLQPISM